MDTSIVSERSARGLFHNPFIVRYLFINAHINEALQIPVKFRSTSGSDSDSDTRSISSGPREEVAGLGFCAKRFKNRKTKLHHAANR